MISILAVVAIQILGFVLILLFLRRWLRRNANAEAVTRKVREELSSLLVELNKTTEQNINLIEDKVESLNRLIDRADKKIGLLKRETEKHEVSRAVYSRINETRPPAGSGGAAAGGAGSGEPGVREGPPAGLAEKVIKLYREGFSAGVIAGHLGTTVGEVELIISLQEGKGR